MKRMLINATQREETRIAIVEGQLLFDLDIEGTAKAQTKANIYKGRVSRIEPSLEAAFVDYGAERHGFLPLKEIAPNYHRIKPAAGSRVNIRDTVTEGQEITVQVEKEERGTKGAALTTYITLAGCYLVLMPSNPKAGGISRRIDREDREALRETLSALTSPDDMGVIIRTAGVGKSVEELQWDLDSLLKQWQAIGAVVNERPAPFLIHQESDIISRCVRDHLRDDISEILIDNPGMYEKTKQHISMVRPEFVDRVKVYNDSVPLFNRYQVERQIESAFQREVRLPSGGSIVIDNTEALISIDINSARATRGGDIEQTALNTNLEAADEIARQLRMRDLGGLIVIDFIDMGPTRNQREVESRLRDAVRRDRARIQLGRISRFGLLEMSRQRLRPSLREGTQIMCPRCSGRGVIRGIESLALSILRLLEEEAIKETGSHIRAYLPFSVATFLINEKKDNIVKVENRHDVKVFIIPTSELEMPHYKIERIKASDAAKLSGTLSYEITYQPSEDDELPVLTPVAATRQEKPAVANIVREQQPTASKNKPPALLGFIKRLFAASSEDENDKNRSTKPKSQMNNNYANRRNSSNRNRNRNSQNRRNNHSRGQQNTRNRNNGNGPRNDSEQRQQRTNNNRNRQRRNAQARPTGSRNNSKSNLNTSSNTKPENTPRSD